MRQNEGLVCALCGKEDFQDCGTNSSITLTAGYGSLHDTERVTMPLCGECIDNLLSELGAKILEQYTKEIPED